MTQYFAVIDNAEFTDRSKFDSDYVFYGTAKQSAAEATRIASQEDGNGVTVYKVKAKPEFVSEEDLSAKKGVQEAFEGTKGKITAFTESVSLPTSKAEAQAKFAELKAQVIEEGTETAATLIATTMMAYQMGTKDPKTLAKAAQAGAKAKLDDVKGRLGGFFQTARQDAQQVQQEVQVDTLKAALSLLDRVVGPDPEALVTLEGQRVVRAAWLVEGNNAEKVGLNDLAVAAAPKTRKTRQPKV